MAKKVSTWWPVACGAIAVLALFLGIGWSCAAKEPTQVNTAITTLPPRALQHWLHTLGQLGPRGVSTKEVEPQQIKMIYDTILDVDTTVLTSVAIDFIHLWPGTVSAGWIDMDGEYHYSHWEYPNVRYGLHLGMKDGKPEVVRYDFGAGTSKSKRWRIELEVGVGATLVEGERSPGTSLAIYPQTEATARWVLGEFLLRQSLSICVIPVGFTWRIPGGPSLWAGLRMSF